MYGPTYSGKMKIYNNKLISKFCELISMGHTIEIACSQVGISRTTYSNWMKRGSCGADDPGFVDDKNKPYIKFKEDVEKAASDFVVSNVTELRKIGIETKNWQCIAWLLERRRPDLFGKRDGSNDNNHQQINVTITRQTMEKPGIE